MRNKRPVEKHIKHLEDRIQYLEELNLFTLDALEMAASLGDFQTSINKLTEPSDFLLETRSRIQRLIEFQAIAFFLVDEAENNFTLVRCDPENYGSYLRNEVDCLIDKGTFAWTLMERRPVIVSSRNYKKQIVLHVMATSSRVRGMFVGLLEKGKTNISDISLSLLSIILLNSSNALESFDLYKMILEMNKNLEEKENYRTLFEAAPDGVEVLDARGNIIDCNSTHQVLLGYSHGEIVGNHTTAFFSNNDKSQFEEKLPTLKETGFAEGEIELVHRQGTIIPVWRKEKAVYNGNKEFVGSVIYNRDISNHKRAEEERKSLEVQLQRAQKMEALGTLAGGIAHDLNNILGGLVSYPELLLMQVPESSPLRKPIITIQQSGQKAATIVQDLLTLARRGVGVTKVVNLNEVISEYLISPEHKKLESIYRNVRFETHLERDLSNILGSPVHLSKTLMNLISNAAEAMADGGKALISTENRCIDRPLEGYDPVEKGDYILLTVSDTGIGISSEDIDRIFEPFYTKKVMGRSGSGLGMAIVWSTMKDHRGYIDVQSTKGRGTTFKLFFPVTSEESTAEETARPVEAYRARGETILVVDDVEEQKEITAMMLTQLGYSVSAVQSGGEAVEHMKNNSRDLLVLDMIMDPGIDGLETYKWILKSRPGQKAVLVSGFSETDRVKEAQSLGAGAFIRKPFTLEDIGLAVRTELDR
jgi:PAS domain S-box-containing protein